MAVGLPLKTTYADGDVYSSSDVNDITGTVNLVGQTTNFYAGKNKIINGNFGVWQRGTSISVAAGGNVFTADRWQAFIVGTTSTASQQTFTPGTAPASPYESQYFHRIATGASTTYYELQQRIEDVRTFAGQSVTYSFWAKASNAHTAAVYINQNFGVSGSANVGTASQNISLTTSWQRFTLTFTLGAMTGKTIGASSYINPFIYYVSGTVASTSIDIWGVQLEAGSTATAFQTATGTIQGELAACQRYYFRTQTGTNPGYFGVTVAGSSTTTYANVIMKQTMRTTPTSVDFSGLKWQSINNSGNITAASISDATPENVLLVCTTTGATTAAMNYLSGQSNTAYVGYSAEL